MTRIYHVLSHLGLITNLSVSVGFSGKQMELGMQKVYWGTTPVEDKRRENQDWQGVFRPHCRSDTLKSQQAGTGEPQNALQSDKVLAIRNSGAMSPFRGGVPSWAAVTMPVPH